MNCNLVFQLCFIYFAISIQPSLSIFEWLFGEDHKDAPEEKQSEEIRFEVLSSDEKFLDFARTLHDLSPLDACYNIVSIFKSLGKNFCVATASFILS